MSEHNEVNQLEEPVAGTEPANNSGAGERLFSQEDVNNIVSKRVSKLNAELDALREQLAAQPPAPAEPPPPTEAELRMQELERREQEFAKRERRHEMGLQLDSRKRPRELMDIFDIDDPEFENKCNSVMRLIAAGRAESEGEAALELKRQRIAREHHIPNDMLVHLTGSTEGELYQNAAELRQVIRTIRGPAPGYDPTNGRVGAEGDAAFLAELFGDKSGHKPRYNPAFGTAPFLG